MRLSAVEVMATEWKAQRVDCGSRIYWQVLEVVKTDYASGREFHWIADVGTEATAEQIVQAHNEGVLP